MFYALAIARRKMAVVPPIFFSFFFGVIAALLQGGRYKAYVVVLGIV